MTELVALTEGAKCLGHIVEGMVDSINGRKLQETNIRCDTQKTIVNQKCTTQVIIAGMIISSVSILGNHALKLVDRNKKIEKREESQED